MQYPPVLPGPDLNYLIHQVSPFVGLILMFVGVRWLLRSPVGEAFAERVRQRSLGRWGVAGGEPRRGGAVGGAGAPARGGGSPLPPRRYFSARRPPPRGGGRRGGGRRKNRPPPRGARGGCLRLPPP